MCSLGLRPNGVSGSLVDSPIVKGSYFQLTLGTRPTQKLHAADGPEALFRSFGARGPIFWSIGGASKTHDF